ncbi:MAG: hypothetical protein WC860_09925, partial [Candidatus Margulisiibacteriota bacterium]
GINTTISVPNLKKIKVNVTNLIKEGEFTFTNTEFNPLFSSLKINLLINTGKLNIFSTNRLLHNR